MKNVLVTGGAGFIGANFIARLLGEKGNITLYNLDKLTYAGDPARLKAFENDNRYKFVHGDICDRKLLGDIFSKGIDTVFHLAAESHVDRSIEDATPFVRSNVEGTLAVLDAARSYDVEKLVHVSTDEVYGELGEEGCFYETSPIRPNSPYSASKAAADLLVSAYVHTYKIPAVTVRPSNNYGPWQYPEKLIPVVISKAMGDKPVPVYAQGLNVREWLYVDDCALGIIAACDRGRVGEAYNIGSGREKRNIEVVRAILSILGKPESLITYVKDRPGHDFRYSLDTAKIRKETGWSAPTDFETGIRQTVEWYLRNEAWWRKFSAS